MLCLLWFAAAAVVGFRLTARDFRWVDRPGFGFPPLRSAAGSVNPSKLPLLHLDVPGYQVPQALKDRLKQVTPQQFACLRVAVKPDRIQSALQGRLTAEEAAAVEACFK